MRLVDLTDPGSAAYALQVDEQVLNLLLVRQGTSVFAYSNSCPHTGGPLDWVPGDFLDNEAQHIQCATHDALFRINDGYCIFGPCRGQSLGVFNCHVDEDGWVAIDI